MRRIKLTVAYDGCNYSGWQIQPNTLTIEQVLDNAINKVTGEKVHVIGASRTDAGVHSFGQVANFNYISSLNFRISREIKGCSNCMINEIIKNNNSIYNTLLISPPGMRQDDIVA